MVGALTENKVLSANIAAYIGLLNVLEFNIQAMFEKAVGGNGRYADAIFGHIQNISTRIDILEALLEVREDELPWAKDAIALIPQVRQANAYRNKLAHALYALQDGKVLIVNNIFLRRAKFKQETITPRDVVREYNKLQQLILDFLHVLDVAPPGFPRKFTFPKL